MRAQRNTGQRRSLPRLLVLVLLASMLLQLTPYQGLRWALGQEDAPSTPILESGGTGQQVPIAPYVAPAEVDSTQAQNDEPASSATNATSLDQQQESSEQQEVQVQDTVQYESVPEEQQLDELDQMAVEQGLERTTMTKEQMEAELERSERAWFVFDGNGATKGQMEDYDFLRDGEEHTLPKATFTREGYVFAGWSTTPSGEDEVLEPNAPDDAPKTPALSVPDEQGITYLVYPLYTYHDDGTFDTTMCDLRTVMFVNDEGKNQITLYAQWVPEDEASQDAADSQNPASNGNGASAAPGREGADALPPLADLGQNADAAQVDLAQSDDQAEQDDRQDVALLATFGPEFTASAVATNGVKVQVMAPAGAFPQGVQLRVKEANKESFMRAVAHTGVELVDAKAADIAFVYNGKEVEPAGGKEVRVSLSLGEALDGDSYAVYHVTDAGEAERVAAASATGATYTASEFSEYGIGGNTAETVKRVRIIFDGAVTEYEADLSQTVIVGDVIADRKAPAPPAANKVFNCWAVGETSISEYMNVVLTEEQINSLAALGTEVEGEVNLYEVTAKPTYRNGKAVYVHNRPHDWPSGSEVTTDTVLTNETYYISVSEIRHVPPTGYTLDKKEPWESRSGSNVVDTFSPEGMFYAGNNDYELYPRYIEYRTLRYDMGEAPNVRSERLITATKTEVDDGSGNTTTRLQFTATKANGDLPTDDELGRNTFYMGYQLVGWYMDKERTIPIGDSFDLEQDVVTIYAKWEPRTDIPYSVWYYLEPAEGKPDGHGEDIPTSKYVLYIKRSDAVNHVGKTDSEIVVKDYDIKAVPDLYYYGESALTKTLAEKVKIKPDGSSIKNIYFNRKYWIITFIDGNNNVISNLRNVYYKYGEKTIDFDPNSYLMDYHKYSGGTLYWFESTGGVTGWWQWPTVNDDTQKAGSKKAAYQSQSGPHIYTNNVNNYVGRSFTLKALSTRVYGRQQRYFYELDPDDDRSGAGRNIYTETILGTTYKFELTRTINTVSPAQYSEAAAASNAAANYFLHRVRYRNLQNYPASTTNTQDINIGESKTVNCFGTGYPVRDVDLYYIRNYFDIRFKNTMGDIISSIKAQYKDKVSEHSDEVPYNENTVLADPSNVYKKYQFVGWYTNPQAADAWYEETNKQYEYTGFEDDSTATIDDDVVRDQGLDLYAAWAVKHYTATFEPDNETIVPSQYLESGELIQEPDAPTKFDKETGAELTFAGWYVNGEPSRRWNFETPITDDIVLVAKWITNGRYTISYLREDGTASTVKDEHTYAFGARAYTQQRDESIPLVLPADEEAGLPERTFAGWSTTQYDTANFTAPGSGFTVSDDTTLYAVYVAKEKVPAAPFVVTLHANCPLRYILSGVDHTYRKLKNETLPLPESMDDWSAPGYHIVSWNTLADGTGVTYSIGSLMIVTGNADLYAQWEVDDDVLTFSKNASNATGMMDTVPGKTFERVAIPTACGFVRPGWDFVGWNTKEDGTGTNYGKGGGAYELTPGDDVLYAQWKRGEDVGDERSITYVANADDATGTMSSTAGHVGQSAGIALCAFERAGYSFDYWSTDPDGTAEGAVRYDPYDHYAFGDNLTLYAQWKAHPDRLRYNDGKWSDSITVNGSTPDTIGFVGSDVTVRDCGYSIDGYSFVGWNTHILGVGDWYYPGDTFALTPGDDVLYARWTKKTGDASLIYHSNYGGETESTVTSLGDLDSTVTVRDCSFGAPVGKWFVRWNTKADFSGAWYYPGDDFVLSAVENHLYAQWGYNVDELVYNKNADDATGTMAPTPGYTGIRVTVSDCNPKNVGNCFYRPGYRFLYWSTRADDVGGVRYYPNDPTRNTYLLTTGDDVLYAIWGSSGGREADVLTYYGNGADGGYTPPTYGYHGDAVSVAVNGFYKTDHVFVGWNTEADGSGTWYYPWDTSHNTYEYLLATRDDVLYAQWESTSDPDPDREIDSLRYEGNATGVEGTMAPTVGLARTTVRVKQNDYPTDGFRLDGHVLVGWNTEADGSGTWYPADGTGLYTLTDADATAGVTGDDVLYAQWQAAEIAITYHKNATDATGAMAPQFVVSGGHANAKTNEFVRPGYQFVQWNTEPDGTGTTYAEGERVPKSGGLTQGLQLYAQWTPAADQLSYDSNGGEGTMDPTLGLTFDTVAIRKCTFTHPDGLGFVGWNTKADGTGVSYDWSKDGYTLTPGEDVLYAQWAHVVRLKFNKNEPEATGTMDDIAVIAGASWGATIPGCEFVWTGHDFLQWNTEPDGSGIAFDPGANIIITEDTTLYAQWFRGFEGIPPLPATGGLGQNALLAWGAVGVVAASCVALGRRRRQGKK